MADKICPLMFDQNGYIHHSEKCLENACAWYQEDEGRCAIASLPTVLDWAVRIAATKPYKSGHEDLPLE